MATTRKATRKPARKATKKRVIELHTLKAIKETRDRWMETAKGYNKKYLLDPIESGMDTVVDLQKNPIRTVERFVDRGKEFIGDMTRDPDSVLSGIVEDGRDFTGDLREDLRSAADNLAEGGKALLKGLKKDVTEGFERTIDKGKTVVDRVPGIGRIREGSSDGLGSVPDRLNLPNKKDMETLAKTVKTLNRKINALSKAQSA